MAAAQTSSLELTRRDGTSVYVTDISTISLVTTREYTSEYFRENPGKPIIRILVPAEGTSPASDFIIDAMMNITLTVDLVNSFIYETIKEELTGVLDEDWKSFGVEIGSKNQEVNPLAPFRVQKVEHNFKGTTTPMAKEVKMGFVAALASIWRLNTTSKHTQNDYNRTILNKINLVVKGSVFKFPEDMILLDKVYMHFNRDETFAKLVACIDQFLCIFPRNKYARMRIGTDTTRFRDCSSLNDLFYIKDLLNLDLETLKKYIWHEGVADDFMTVTKSGEEIDNYKSYTAYMKNYDLSERSPYSVSANPNLHFWIHSIGTLMGMARSKNSKFVQPRDPVSIANIALVTSYFFSKSTGRALPSSSPRMGTIRKDAQEISFDGVTNDRLFSEVDGRSPEQVYGFMLRHKTALPEVIIDWAKGRLAEERLQRPGTTLAFLKGFFGVG